MLANINQYKNLIWKLKQEHCLAREEWKKLIGLYEQKEQSQSDKLLWQEVSELAAKQAREMQHKYFGSNIYIRGLIEISNYCKNNCYYCGIRRENVHAQRYRLSKEEIMACCKQGHELGFRTFVLQGGEDGTYTDELLCDLIKSVKLEHPDCAITLSLGERNKKSYQALKEAGADRYLLRHETADKEHYQKLHPEEMSFDHRMECLQQLKELGYQVGCGFMVGSPWQTVDTLVDELLFIQTFSPEMVGIGPFIPHHDTPFAKMAVGSVDLTVYLLSLIRLCKPTVLLPATTALGSLEENGRQRGILAGANVVMPNLSPQGVRKKYELYDNKLSSGAEAAESLHILEKSLHDIGYQILVDRGDGPIK